MAHFAEIVDGCVARVVVVSNDVLRNENGVEQESLGVEFCQRLWGWWGNWVQTSYSGSFRNKFAGCGDTYDAVRDAFIAPQPFSSWTLNSNTLVWEPPTPYPQDGNVWFWDEETLSWISWESWSAKQSS